MIQKKVCSKCGVEKEISEFQKRKKSKDGYDAQCKSCKNKKRRKYRAENRDIILKKDREYKHKNRDILLAKRRIYKEKNKEKIKKQSKEYYQNNIDRIKEYAIKNKETIRRSCKRYYRNIDNNIIIKLKSRIFDYNKIKNKKYSIDDLFFIKEEYILNIKKMFNKKYSEDKFINGEIEMHHIKPLRECDYSNINDFNNFFHYSNVELLTKSEHKLIHSKRDYNKKIDKKKKVS